MSNIQATIIPRKDFKKFFEDFELTQLLYDGEIKCYFCRQTITLNNLNKIVIKYQTRYICDKIVCQYEYHTSSLF